MYKITKQFDFCYGHRVHNQTLNQKYSLDSKLVCRHLHGHQGQITVILEAEELENDMVTDFKHLNFFKKWLDDTLDHKFILDVADPLLITLFKGIPVSLMNTEEIFRVIPDEYIRRFSSEELKEVYGGIVLTSFNPTSENLCKHIFMFLKEKLIGLNVTLKSIEFKETPKTSAVITI